MKSSSLVLAALLAAIPAAASAQDHCSRETLSVRGTPVTIGYCLTAPAAQSGPEVTLAVAATYASAGGSFEEHRTMRFITGEGPARVLENVNLARLGLTGTLHLTLVYAADRVEINSAMLTPGAIIVK
jgi:hypothetical protein